MRRIIIFVLILAMLSGCQPAAPTTTLQNTVTQIPTEIAQPPTVTPIPSLTLPIPQPENQSMLIETSEGFLQVSIPDDFDQNHPPMVSYIWENIQPDVHQGIQAIILDFDLPDSPESEYRGYNRRFFIGLHDLDPIQQIYQGNQELEDETQSTHEISRNDKLLLSELMIDLQSFVHQENQHVQIRIPYNQFLGGARDLTLQFLPGATFGNLTMTIEHDGSLTSTDIETLQVEPEQVDFNSGDYYRSCVLQYSDSSNPWVERRYDELETYELHIRWDMRDNLFNEGGTLNIPVKNFDMDQYADQVQGDYAVIPEGMLPTLSKYAEEEYVWFNFESRTLKNEDRRILNHHRQQVVDFIFNNMMDPETGLIHGIWDIDQDKLIATDRRVGNLPFFGMFADYRFYNVIEKEELEQYLKNIIKHEVVYIDGEPYYLPRGIDKQGRTELHLVDFSFNIGVYRELTGYAIAWGRQEGGDRAGIANLLMGVANSLALIQEQQAANPTHLPSEVVVVEFHEDGSYKLTPQGDFHIDNYFFSRSPGELNLAFHGYFKFLMDQMGELNFDEALLEGLTYDPDPDPEEWYNVRLMETWATAAEADYGMQILNSIYTINYHIVNFAKIQSPENAYYPAYDVFTGEPIPSTPLSVTEDFSAPWWDCYYPRFGSNPAIENWQQVVGLFNDPSIQDTPDEIHNLGRSIFYLSVLNVLEEGPQPLSFYTYYDFRENHVGISTKNQINTPFFHEAEIFAWREEVEPWDEVYTLLGESSGFMGHIIRHLSDLNAEFTIPPYPFE